jgi:hypothetical protein
LGKFANGGDSDFLNELQEITCETECCIGKDENGDFEG